MGPYSQLYRIIVGTTADYSGLQRITADYSRLQWGLQWGLQRTTADYSRLQWGLQWIICNHTRFWVGYILGYIGLFWENLGFYGFILDHSIRVNHVLIANAKASGLTALSRLDTTPARRIYGLGLGFGFGFGFGLGLGLRLGSGLG